MANKIASVLARVRVHGAGRGRAHGKPGPGAGEGAGTLTQRALGSFGKGGDVLAAFVAFMALPGALITDVALKLAEIVDSTGIKGLTDALRNQLNLKIDPALLLVCDDVIEALGLCPEIGDRAGVKAQALATWLGQGDEIRGLAVLFTKAQGLVDDARLLLQAWLFTAEQALSLEVFREMAAAQGQDLWQLLGDAGPALDFIEEDLKRRQADLQKSGKAIAGLQGQLDQINNDIQMLQTMQQVRAQQPQAQLAALDENTLRSIAQHFATRMGRR